MFEHKPSIRKNYANNVSLSNGESNMVLIINNFIGISVHGLPRWLSDTNSVPGLGRSPGEGDGNPLQYSCLGNPMDEEPSGLQSVELQKTWT